MLLIILPNHLQMKNFEKTDVPVLIQCESATGKELIANAIQRQNLRRGKPYIKINCAAISETLFEA